MSFDDAARCTATGKRTGERCRQPAMKGSTKCRMHGGASLAGIASPSFRHGRYSKHLPTRLAARYAEALADTELVTLRDDIALVDTRQSELLDTLDAVTSRQRWQAAGEAHADVMDAITIKDPVLLQSSLRLLGDILSKGVGEYSAWQEILLLVEQRRKLVDSEARRLVETEALVRVEQVVAVLAFLTASLKRHVADPTVRAKIVGDLRTVIRFDQEEV